MRVREKRAWLRKHGTFWDMHYNSGKDLHSVTWMAHCEGSTGYRICRGAQTQDELIASLYDSTLETLFMFCTMVESR